MPNFSDQFTVIPNAENPEKPTILVHGSVLNLIPKSLYDGNLEQQYWDIQSNADTAEINFSNELEDYVALFKCNFSEIVQIPNFRTANVDHFLVHCHRLVHQKFDKNYTENLIFVTFCGDFFHFWLEKDGKLQIVGRSTFATEFDILYYLMNLTKQFALAPTNLQLLICDDKKTNDGAIKLLKTYFANVNTLDNYL